MALEKVDKMLDFYLKEAGIQIIFPSISGQVPCTGFLNYGMQTLSGTQNLFVAFMLKLAHVPFNSESNVYADHLDF